jgi:hypothetical protein
VTRTTGCIVNVGRMNGHPLYFRRIVPALTSRSRPPEMSMAVPDASAVMEMTCTRGRCRTRMTV